MYDDTSRGIHVAAGPLRLNGNGLTSDLLIQGIAVFVGSVTNATASIACEQYGGQQTQAGKNRPLWSFPSTSFSGSSQSYRLISSSSFTTFFVCTTLLPLLQSTPSPSSLPSSALRRGQSKEEPRPLPCNPQPTRSLMGSEGRGKVSHRNLT